MKFKVPILFLVFNRPDTTARVFEQIRKIQPAYLYVAADGPRENKPGEKEICAKVRSLVLSQIDWECEIKTLFRDENLGCGKAVSEAIDWFFENVEEGIILEDDTLPDLSFFNYCEVLLDRYRFDDKVMHIGGDNFQFGIKRGDGDYYFSTLSHIWGWATWRRAWVNYEFDLTKSESISDIKYEKAFNGNIVIQKYYHDIFEKVSLKKIDTWDYQWLATIIGNVGMVICPNKNLVQNIGFGVDATHTTKPSPDWIRNNIPESLVSFIKPSNKEIDYAADAYALNTTLGIIQTDNNLNISQRIIVHTLIRRTKIKFKKVLQYILHSRKVQNVFLDKTARVSKSATVEVRFGGRIDIGANSELLDGVLVLSYGGHIMIGQNCSINPYTIIYGHGGTKIGNNVLIAGHCMIIPSNHNYDNREVPINMQGNTSRGILIEDDVWIGHGCSILDGVTLGKGCIVSAGSVVTKSVDPYSIVGGIPARKLKDRP